ncbi:amino acid ABC transporter substrate-binding protein [Nocardioides agariphilus]|uniref:Amino acid ABC transporter substrate-binding protein n=1 Tax=Nocardioides agariphilus TaxID=433664 RepID=A0A930VKR4_9ACTN|nr:transporter substrate-binding domain-containing protein [Nocardioides agariphilus]MBF4769339.1 amino acid ABC transporter substrate-binding protein [Nocardioides agariphilus]
MTAVDRAPRTKRVGIMVVVAFMVACLAACGSDDDSSTGKDSAGEKTLTVGVQLSYAPYEYVEGGEVTGFEVDLVEEVLGRLGYKTEWKNIPFDTIFTAVSAGKIDMAASTINGWAPEGSLVYDVVKQRTEIVSLSRPIYLVKYLVVSNKTKNPDLKSTDQLVDGMTVAVVQGSSEYEYAQKELAPRGVRVVTVPSGAQAFTLVESGRADATFAEAGAIAAAAEQQTNLQPGEPISSLEAGYAWAFPLDDPEFVDDVNATIGEVIEDGTYAKIFEKYFPGATAPTDLPTASFSAGS